MKALMYGAGSIGRGFMAQLFYESGYDVVFIDLDQPLIDKINQSREYPIRFVHDDESQEIVVRNVSGIYAQDSAAISREIATANIMATSVGKNALPSIAKEIARGIRGRLNSGNRQPLNIIVCENMIGANKYLRSLIKDELSPVEIPYFDQSIGTVETCIGRNVPLMTDDLKDGNPLRVIAEEYNELPVCSSDFIGDIPSICHMKPYPSFDYHIQKKLFVYNMAHALVSYLGDLHDFIYLADAIKAPDIEYITLRALLESSMAMSREYQVGLDELVNFSFSLLSRFGNRPLGITIARTGLDPIRKLSGGDRLMGAAKLCQKHGVTPAFIALGIAAGYCYKNKDDGFSLQLNDYIRENGIEKAISKYSGLGSGDALTKYISQIYGLLQQDIPYDQLIDVAQKYYLKTTNTKSEENLEYVDDCSTDIRKK